MSEQLGSYVAQHTLYAFYRPFGVTSIVGGVDEDGPQLYMIEPSGLYWVRSYGDEIDGRDTSVLRLGKENRLLKMSLRNLI